MPCLSLSLVHTSQLGNRQADFHEIWYWRVSPGYVEPCQIYLKTDTNNGPFYMNIEAHLDGNSLVTL
jgi:hypothetical protein